MTGQHVRGGLQAGDDGTVRPAVPVAGEGQATQDIRHLLEVAGLSFEFLDVVNARAFTSALLRPGSPHNPRRTRMRSREKPRSRARRTKLRRWTSSRS